MKLPNTVLAAAAVRTNCGVVVGVVVVNTGARPDTLVTVPLDDDALIGVHVPPMHWYVPTLLTLNNGATVQAPVGMAFVTVTDS